MVKSVVPCDWYLQRKGGAYIQTSRYGKIGIKLAVKRKTKHGEAKHIKP